MRNRWSYAAFVLGVMLPFFALRACAGNEVYAVDPASGKLVLRSYTEDRPRHDYSVERAITAFRRVADRVATKPECLYWVTPHGPYGIWTAGFRCTR